MILTTTNDVPGREVLEILGIAKGASVRARHAGRNILAALRGHVGGEITEMTKVIAEAREQALDRMRDDARRMGADAILAIRYTSTEVMSNAAEFVVYGTAVKLRPVESPE
ncbi:MAG: YbjQ family protein [Planctomycetota bacterium]